MFLPFIGQKLHETGIDKVINEKIEYDRNYGIIIFFNLKDFDFDEKNQLIKDDATMLFIPEDLPLFIEEHK